MNAPDQIDAQFWSDAAAHQGGNWHAYEAFKRRWQAQHPDADPVSHEYAMQRLVVALRVR